MSRIIELNAQNGTHKVVLEGKDDSSFFTAIMGTHQRLTNGNILVNSSGKGRVIEFAPDGTIVWRYDNRLSDGRNGRVYMAMLLPEYMDAEFFKKRYRECN
jgi:outer membrane protein assembly factor BamB